MTLKEAAMNFSWPQNSIVTGLSMSYAGLMLLTVGFIGVFAN